MKREVFLICLLAVLFFQAAAQKQASFTINGTVDSVADGTAVHLRTHPEMEKGFVLSTLLKKGKFRFKGTISYPVEASIIVGNLDSAWQQKRLKGFWIEGGTITVAARKNAVSEAVINGSGVTDEAERFEKEVSDEEADSLRYKRLVAYIRQHPNSYPATGELFSSKAYLPLADVKEAYGLLSPTQKATPVGQQLGKYLSLNTGLKLGDTAPDFAFTDLGGNKVSLSGYRGKILLLDFADQASEFMLNHKLTNEVLGKLGKRPFVLVSVWLNGKNDLINHLSTIRPEWKLLYTENGFESDIAYAYGLQPGRSSRQVLVDPDGRFVIQGDFSLLMSTDGKGLLRFRPERGTSEHQALNEWVDASMNTLASRDAEDAITGPVDTLSKGSFTLYIKDRQNALSKEYKQRLAEAYFRQYPRLVEKYNPQSPKAVTFFIDPTYNGVAEAWGARVRFNPAWFHKNPEDLDVVTHETMHLVQGYGYNGVPVWVTEGIADYVRATEGFNNKAAGWSMPDLAATHKYDNAYRITARFFVWITQRYDKDFVKNLNEAARGQTYSETTWRALTGKTVDELWNEYKADPAIN